MIRAVTWLNIQICLQEFYCIFILTVYWHLRILQQYIGMIILKLAWSAKLKESATNKKTWTVFVQDVSHNINLMRVGKWRRLNMISRRLNIPTQRFLFAWERRHSFWFGSRFCKRFTWSPGARIPDVTSFTLILCVLRMCETHYLYESDYIGVYTLLLFCEYHWFIYWLKIDWNERLLKSWSLNY